jgi:L-amino acid N-acyltransferase YncA
MDNKLKIRLITPADAASTLEIYRPYVQNTIISFEYQPPTIQEWEDRIDTYTADYPWLICEYNSEIIGYAYGCRHRYRTAYCWSAESSVYLLEKFQRLGIAGALYRALFAILKLQGYINVYAGVGLPNVKSEKFHEALGFYDVGIFKKIGFKLGGWHDTRWFQLHLAEHPENPAMPQQMNEVLNTKALNEILATANTQMKSLRPKIESIAN